uniref:Uncharacterized protein n=1 Tax=Timema monikensis TaxID=170555 RepID=A0A7R9E1Y7_9NEOP|nr:unnamed protein product [Timema monikensis]
MNPTKWTLNVKAATRVAYNAIRTNSSIKPTLESLVVVVSAGTLLVDDIQTCHRQGTYVDKVGEQRKHKFKSQGSNKIGSGCSSFIEMIHDGQNINVTYYKTHCGHSSTLERVMLTKEDRIRIAGLIESGITLQHILDKICVSATEENFQRIHMITKKDLENICREFSLHTEKQNTGDATNVDVWVDGMNSLSKEENPVVFYKARGTCDMNNILSVDDFCLVIMTSFQKNMLENHLETCQLQENDARSIEQGLDGLLYLIRNAGLTEEITLQPKELSSKRKQEQETLHTTKWIRSNTDQRIPKPSVPMLDGLTIELLVDEVGLPSLPGLDGGDKACIRRPLLSFQM